MAVRWKWNKGLNGGHCGHRTVVSLFDGAPSLSKWYQVRDSMKLTT